MRYEFAVAWYTWRVCDSVLDFHWAAVVYLLIEPLIPHLTSVVLPPSLPPSLHPQ